MSAPTPTFFWSRRKRREIRAEDDFDFGRRSRIGPVHHIAGRNFEQIGLRLDSGRSSSVVYQLCLRVIEPIRIPRARHVKPPLG